MGRHALEPQAAGRTVISFLTARTPSTLRAMLSGFAKSTKEKATAEAIARDVKGVKSVKNEIAVRQ